MSVRSGLRSRPVRIPVEPSPEEPGADRHGPLVVLPWIWGSWLAVVLVLGLIGPERKAEWLGSIVVVIHLTAVLGILLVQLRRSAAMLLGASLILRAALVVWDTGFSDVYLLPGSGTDSEMYLYWAGVVAGDPSLLLQDFRGGVFSKIVGLLFWVTGVDRVFGQYTNALLGLSVVVLVDAAMERLAIGERQRTQVLAVAALLPNSLILSAVFLRESLIAFLIAASLYLFVVWFQTGGIVAMASACILVLGASTMHAGVAAVCLAYMGVAVVYDRRRGRLGMSWGGLGYLIVAVIAVQVVLVQYPDVFLGKFDAIGGEADLLTTVNRRGGEAQYLAGLTVESPMDVLRVGPLRAVYFLGSPMPWDWRGFIDAVTFATDSLFFLGAPILFFVERRGLPREARILGYSLVGTIAAASLVFGAGVSNAGTALRHRYKLAAIFALLLALALSGRAGRIGHDPMRPEGPPPKGGGGIGWPTARW